MRAEIPLTESLCRKALRREKNYKLTDGDGLYLLVQANGMRYWRMNYREGGSSAPPFSVPTRRYRCMTPGFGPSTFVVS